MGEARVFELDPAALTPHPDQVAIYGEGTPAEDDELVASIERTNHVEVITVAWNTPDLADDTIISGHRRARAARRLGRTVMVHRVKYASRAHADQAHILLNKQREKNQAVRTLEAAALARIEGVLAKQRQRMSPGRPAADEEKGSARRAQPLSTGRASEKVAEKTGEGATTVETRLKLFAIAQEQKPEDPASAPVMQDLAVAKSVGAVANKYGVGRSGSKRPAAKTPALDFAGALAAFDRATTHREVEAAYGALAGRFADLTAEQQAATRAAYVEAGKRVQKPKRDPKPAIGAPVDAAADRLRRERAVRTESFLREMRSLLQRAGELLHDDPIAHADGETIAECARVADLLIQRLRERVLDIRTPHAADAAE